MLATVLKEAPIDQLDSELLLAHVLQKDRAWLLAHSDFLLNEEQNRMYADLIARRNNGEPLAYLINEKEFYGRPFYVDRRVLIPRPSTETLIDVTLQYFTDACEQITEADTDIVIFSKTFRKEEPKLIVEVGTGSGCIGITLVVENIDTPIICTDVSNNALNVARKNAKQHGVEGRIIFHTANLLEGLQIDVPFLLVSNPPYIPENEEMMKDVRDHEPELALFAGSDGMSILNPLFEQAKSHPKCVGCILECRLEQAKKFMSQE